MFIIQRISITTLIKLLNRDLWCSCNLLWYRVTQVTESILLKDTSTMSYASRAKSATPPIFYNKSTKHPIKLTKITTLLFAELHRKLKTSRTEIIVSIKRCDEYVGKFFKVRKLLNYNLRFFINMNGICMYYEKFQSDKCFSGKAYLFQ